jgi:hypothetical protein
VTLEGRKQIAEALIEIVQREYTRAHGVPVLVRRGLLVLVEQAHQMGLAPEDFLTPNGHDAFVTIARAIFALQRPKKPRGILGAEWKTVLQLAA